MGAEDVKKSSGLRMSFRGAKVKLSATLPADQSSLTFFKPYTVYSKVKKTLEAAVLTRNSCDRCDDVYR